MDWGHRDSQCFSVTVRLKYIPSTSGQHHSPQTVTNATYYQNIDEVGVGLRLLHPKAYEERGYHSPFTGEKLRLGISCESQNHTAS